MVVISYDRFEFYDKLKDHHLASTNYVVTPIACFVVFSYI